jgi:hypothetical protein
VLVEVAADDEWNAHGGEILGAHNEVIGARPRARAGSG